MESGPFKGNTRVPLVLEAADVGVERAQTSVADYVRFVMDSDRKLGPMKSLQVSAGAFQTRSSLLYFQHTPFMPTVGVEKERRT